jgi:hypothetical protein
MAESFPEDPILNLQKHKPFLGTEKYKDRWEKKIAFEKHLGDLGIEKKDFEKLKIVRFDDKTRLHYRKENTATNDVESFWDQKMKRNGYALVMVTDIDASTVTDTNGDPLVDDLFISSIAKGHGVDGKVLNPVASFYSNQRFNRTKDEKWEQQVVNTYLDIGTLEAKKTLEELSLTIEADSRNADLTHSNPNGNRNNVTAYNPWGSPRTIEAETRDIRLRRMKLQAQTWPLQQQEYESICEWNAQLKNDLLLLRTNQIQFSTRNLEEDMVQLTYIKQRLLLNQSVPKSEIDKVQFDVAANEVIIKSLQKQNTGWKDVSTLWVKTPLFSNREVFTFKDKKDFWKKVDAYNMANWTNYTASSFAVQGNNAYLAPLNTVPWASGGWSSSAVDVLSPQQANDIKTSEVSIDKKPIWNGEAETHLTTLKYYGNMSFSQLLPHYQSIKNSTDTDPASNAMIIKRALVYSVFSGISWNDGKKSAQYVFEQLGNNDIAAWKEVFKNILSDTLFHPDNILWWNLNNRLWYAVYVKNNLQQTDQSAASSNSWNAWKNLHGLWGSNTKIWWWAPQSLDDIIIQEAVELFKDQSIWWTSKNLSEYAIRDVLQSEPFGSTGAANMFTDIVQKNIWVNLWDPVANDSWLGTNIPFMDVGAAGVTELAGVKIAEVFWWDAKTAEKIEHGLNVTGQLLHKAVNVMSVVKGVQATYNYLRGAFDRMRNGFKETPEGKAFVEAGNKAWKTTVALMWADLAMDFMSHPHSFLDKHPVARNFMMRASPDFKDTQQKKQVVKNLEWWETTSLSDLLNTELFQNYSAKDVVGPWKLIREKNGILVVDPNILRSPMYSTNPELQKILSQPNANQLFEKLAKEIADNLVRSGVEVTDLQNFQNSTNTLVYEIWLKQKKTSMRDSYSSQLWSLWLKKDDIMNLPDDLALQEKEKVLMFAADQLNKLNDLTTSAYFNGPDRLANTSPWWSALLKEQKVSGKDFATILQLPDQPTAPAASQTAMVYINNLLKNAITGTSITDVNFSTNYQKYFKALAYMSESFLKSWNDISHQWYWDSATNGNPKNFYDYFTTGMNVPPMNAYDAIGAYVPMTPPWSWTVDITTSTITATQDRATMTA